MAGLRLNRELSFTYGEADRVSPLIRRIIARNPSAFTFHGTGTYIVGHGKVAVIDPGPDLDEHVQNLLRELDGETVTHIVVTHTHRDHSPAARPLQAATGAPTYGFGPHGSGRPEAEGEEVEEGGDALFDPDVTIRDGDLIEGAGWSLQAVYTPGHTSNHLCFALPQERALFPGDHVMGWSTTVVSPPDGDMRAYMESLRKLAARDDQRYWPTHGGPIDRPQDHVRALIAHREERERQIMACLDAGVVQIGGMVQRMYADVPALLHPAAGRSVLAHLIHMVEDGRVRCDGPLGPDALYTRA